MGMAARNSSAEVSVEGALGPSGAVGVLGSAKLWWRWNMHLANMTNRRTSNLNHPSPSAETEQ
jgi:hypothetical protein